MKICKQCGKKKVHSWGLCTTCYSRWYTEKNKEHLAEVREAAKTICIDCGNKTGKPTSLRCRKCSNIYRAQQAKTEASIQQKHENRLARNHRWFLKNKDRWISYSSKRRARLLDADNGQLTPAIWKLLIDLYDNRCAYCFEKFDNLEQDHVIPLSRGGKHIITNVVPACMFHNRSKRDSLIAPIHPMYEFLVNKYSTPPV